jgi:hypothetical protein
MKFASCRINNGKLLISSFSKEYNKSSFEELISVDFDHAHDIIKEFDHLDLVLPGKDVFFYSRNYPPVNESQLKKIVIQDIESDTPFRENELLTELKTAPLEPTKVFCVTKESVRNYFEKFDQSEREKIRSIIPEEYLAFKCLKGVEKAIFIGDDYSFFITDSGKIVKNTGTIELKKELATIFGGDTPESDLDVWQNTGADISKSDDLSDIELRIRKAVSNFFNRVISDFTPFSENQGPTTVFINDVVPEGTEKIVSMIDSSPFSDAPFNIVTVNESLEMASLVPEKGNFVNFAKGEFAYKGGFTFLKKRILLGAVLYLLTVIFLISGMQRRVGYLNERIETIDERTKTVMKEVLGKEYPSLRQAISVMNQTIQGEQGAADRKSVYSYSALNIMEAVFPLIAFEESSIEISELSIREEGKIRIAGIADNLDDINKLSDNLNGHQLITDLNRGQINTRGDKSSFNVTFEYGQLKKSDSKSVKSRKKGSN